MTTARQDSVLPFDPVVARLDDERLPDERGDDPPCSGRVVVWDELDEAVDVLVGREVVAGDGELEPEHLRRAGRLVRVHLACEERAGPGDQVRELPRQRAAEQPDGRLVQLADQPHVEDAGVAVVVDPDARLGLDDERDRVADHGAPVGERRHRPVMALDRSHDDPGDLDHDPPRRRRDLVGRDAVVDQLRPNGRVADHGRARALRDRRRVAVVVDRRVADEDHVRRAEIVGPTRCERVVR